MKPFGEWPLDGQIGFIAIIAILAMLVFGHFIKEKEKDTFANERFYFLPPLSYKIYLSEMLLACSLITYGVSQAGDCFNMTAEENTSNFYIGVLLATLLWGGTLAFLYKSFLTKISFDASGIVVRSPWSETKYNWADFTEVAQYQNSLFVLFKDGRKFNVPTDYHGFIKFRNLVFSKMHSITNPPAPLFFDEAVGMLVGKQVFVSVLTSDKNINDVIKSQFSGRFTEVRENHIVIEKEDGSVFEAPKNLKSIFPIADYQDKVIFPWDIQIPNGRKYDYVAVYYTTEGSLK